MSKKLQFSIIIIILFSALVLYAYVQVFAIESARGKQGRMLISEEADPKKVYSLKGAWSFIPGELLGPGDDFSGAESVNIRNAWNFSGIKSFSTPEITFGTYRLILTTPFSDKYTAFKIPVINSAYRLYVNGTLLGQKGVPGTSADIEQVEIGSEVYRYFQGKQELEIILQISNFHARFSRQLMKEIEYGDARSVESWNSASAMLNGAIITILLILSGIFLVRFFAFRNEFLSLFLALFFFMSSIFQFISAPAYLTNFFHALSGGIYFRLEAFFYSITYPLFYGFLCSYFGIGKFKRNIHWPVIFLSAAAMIMIWIIPVHLVNIVVIAFTAIILITGIIFFFILVSDKIRRKEMVFMDVLQFTGFFILVAPMIHDTVYAAGIIRSFLLTDYCILMFGLVEFMILSEKTFTAQTHFRQISSEIKKYEQFADEFYGYASHELRNPIHSIVGLAESLLIKTDDKFLSPDQRVSVAQIAASGMRLSNQVNDLIDFSRIRTQNLSINTQPLDIFQLIELVKRITYPLTSLKKLEIENRLKRDTPEIIGDEGRIEQMLYSFVMLGHRFMDSGCIAFEGNIEEKHLKMIVSYECPNLEGTGILNILAGIGKDKTIKEGFENSALSLIVVKEILKLHDSELEHKHSGDKLEFTFAMDVSTIDRENVFQESMDMNVLVNLEDQEDKAEDTKPLTILIADDNIVDLQIMVNFLRMLEVNIHTRRNGRAVLEEIKKHPPDLLLMDVLMPKMNGYDVCKKVREKHASSELPIILINRRDRGFDIMQGINVGANDFIIKPIIGEELLARVKTHLQLSRVSSLYSKFVPKELIHSLGRENILEMQLGDQVQQEMTVFFADIREFTMLSESMTPKENFKFINSYLSRISPIIQKYNGFIDKYIGDSIMALYPDSPDNAVQTAIEMMKHIHVYNGHRANSGYRPIRIGVGIHTGNCIMGVIGDGERMQGTVISDAVNLASRVQDVTKLYGANIIISQDTFVHLENPLDYSFRFLGKAKVKGKEKTVSLFEIFDGDTRDQKEFKILTKVDFETAILLFAKQQFAEAVELFQKIVKKNPEDRAAVLFLDRSQKLLAISASMPNEDEE